MITVEEFTSPAPITIELSAGLDEILKIMQEHQIRHLPVTDKDKVVGVLSERDLVANMNKQWSSMVKAEDIMNDSIIYAYTNENLGDVAFRLSNEKVGSAVILDVSGKLFGIFTTTDALNALVELLQPQANQKSDVNL